MDFPDLTKDMLAQKPRRMWNLFERIRVERTLNSAYYYESMDFLDKINGFEFLESGFPGVDCHRYLVGKASPEKLVQGVFGHDGNPMVGDLIIYGYDLNHPTHLGLVEATNGNLKIRSKWGDNGPIMSHNWNQVPLGLMWLITRPGNQRVEMK